MLVLLVRLTYILVYYFNIVKRNGVWVGLVEFGADEAGL